MTYEVIYGACHRDSVPQGNLVSTNQKHEPDLRRSTLSVWYGIWVFDSRGNQWWQSRNVRCFLRLHILQIILCYDTISDKRDGGTGRRGGGGELAAVQICPCKGKSQTTKQTNPYAYTLARKWPIKLLLLWCLKVLKEWGGNSFLFCIYTYTILDTIKWTANPCSSKIKDEAAPKPRCAIFPAVILGGRRG